MSKAFLPCLTLAGVCALASAFSYGAGLRISLDRENRVLTCVPVEQERFELSFIHSVSITPVTDYYRLIEAEEGTLSIKQTAETFIAHGQGLPSLVDEPDALSFENDHGLFVLKMDRDIHNLIVRTDKRFRNRLRTGDTTLNLNQWPDAGLRIVPVSNCHQ